MSIRALIYARSCLRRDDCPLIPTERLVFRTLADSCNSQTGQAYTGIWLAVECGVDMRTVRRALHRLRDDGYLRLEDRSREGKSSVVTFPTGAYISTAPVTSDTPEQMYRPDMGVRAPLSRVSPISGSSTPDVTELSNNLELSREAWCCDGTGFTYDEATRSSAPCPLHHPNRKGAL